MRILQVISQFPGKTGSGTYLQAIHRHGKLEGNEMGIVAGFSNIQEAEEANISELFPVIFNSRELPFSIPGMSDVMPYPSTRYFDMDAGMVDTWINAFTLVIKKAVESFKPDIIISHHLWLLTSLVKKLCPNIPLAAICHGTDLVQFTKVPQLRNYVIEGCNRLKIIFSLNDKQRASIISNYGISNENIITIGGGYDSDIFFKSNRKIHDKTIRIIYAGKLSFSKGVPSLIRAFEELKAKYVGIKLLLAGTGCGNEMEYIQRQVSNSCADIELLGHVPHSELGEAFRKCDVFVLPSFYEGLSLVTLEALACGLGIVTTENEGLMNLLGEKVNKSGILEYVKLPPLEKIDLPVPELLEPFEHSLSRAIYKRIRTLDKIDEQFDGVKGDLEVFSWKNIYSKITEVLLKNT